MFLFFFKRLVIYPLLFSGIFYILLTNYPDHQFVYTLVGEYLKQYKALLPTGFTDKFYILTFGLLFGYAWGTISSVFQLRQMKTITSILIVGYLKLTVSVIFALTIGIFIYPFEVILLPILLFLFRNRKNKGNSRKIRTKEDILREIEKLKKEYDQLQKCEVI